MQQMLNRTLLAVSAALALTSVIALHSSALTLTRIHPDACPNWGCTTNGFCNALGGGGCSCNGSVCSTSQ